MSQLEKVKLLLGITDNNKDFILEFVISRVENAIKNDCNLDKIPVELEDVVLNMAIKLYRLENFGSEEAGQTVKSIAVGDTSTTFETHESNDLAKCLIKDFKAQIAPFRRVRW